ncbi:MAG: hypothetical protein ACLGI5_16690 [Thermoleophilia bacterium]
MRTAVPTTARTIEAGMLLIGLGAILLLISLFLEWYQPGAEAWDVFEVWDLVLSLLAIGALVAVAGRLGFGPPRPATWLIAPAVAALVIVLYALIDPPPLTSALPDGDPGTGLWIALAASILMAAGALLSVARISVAITAAGSGDAQASPAAPHPQRSDPAPADASQGSGRFVRGDAAHEPVGPGGAGTASEPTEPTRRL